MAKAHLLAILIVAAAFSAHADDSAPSGSTRADPQKTLDELVAAEKAEQAKAQAAANARRANPVAWAQSLDPLPQGHWNLIFVASDGTDAIFASKDQEVHKGGLITMWTRTEYGDFQSGGYISSVEKDQYDCAHARVRMLSRTSFTESNLKGSAQTDEQPNAGWYSVFPGSAGEDIWRYVCGKH